MNPKEFVHNTAYSVQLPYIAGRRSLPLSTTNIAILTKSQLKLEFFCIYSYFTIKYIYRWGKPIKCQVCSVELSSPGTCQR